jgi:hypothetical protein
VIVLSGIAATTRGGTGRLLLGLLEEQRTKKLDVRFVFVGNRANVARSLLLRDPFSVGREAVKHYLRRAARHWLLRQREFVEAPRMVILHPQEIGTRWLDALITKRSLAGRVTELFVLDASFFCVRSYNHLPDESAPCLRCLRDGPSEARRLGCQSFPLRDRWATSFIRRIRDHARRGAVAFWTQTEGYRDLLEQFMGPDVRVGVAGLWTDDFSSLDSSFPAASPLADIVYHGSWHDAKGATWALSLAAVMPDRTFLFPCGKPAAVSPPPNAVFRALAWDTGLAEQVQASPLCLVPSLWTAPIEGALVKSIAHSSGTAVVADTHGFVGELPNGLVLRLPGEVAAAADRLRRNWPWRVDRVVRDRWVKSFTAANSGLLARLVVSSPPTVKIRR